PSAADHRARTRDSIDAVCCHAVTVTAVCVSCPLAKALVGPCSPFARARPKLERQETEKDCSSEERRVLPLGVLAARLWAAAPRQERPHSSTSGSGEQHPRLPF
ncbi:unnamed protein product, partial [Laminaria digitata]